MSPTSYQAAPPRGSTSKVRRPDGVSSAAVIPRLFTSGISRRRKTIEQFLVPPHHAEHFARDALLRRRITLDLRRIVVKRIHDALKRVDVVRHALAPAALSPQVERAELASLHREQQTAGRDRDPKTDVERRAAAQRP